MNDALVEKLDNLQAGLDAGREQERELAEENIARQTIDVSAEIAKLERLLAETLPQLTKENEPTWERFEKIDLSRLAIHRAETSANLDRQARELLSLTNGSYERSIKETMNTLRELRPEFALAAAGMPDYAYQQKIKAAIKAIDSHEGIIHNIPQARYSLEKFLDSIPPQFFKEKRVVHYPPGSAPEQLEKPQPRRKPRVKKDYSVIG